MWNDENKYFIDWVECGKWYSWLMEQWTKQVGDKQKFIWRTGNYINPEGGRLIGEALITNTTLTSLNLGSDEITEWIVNEREPIWTSNRIGDEGATEGARMISEALKTNTTLTDLNLESDEFLILESNWWIKLE